MLAFLNRHKVLIALFAFWFFLGRVSIPAFYAVGVVSILLMWRKAMYFEILLGFFFILILSDNLGQATDFAKNFKNIYIVLLAGIALFDRDHFQPFNRLFLLIMPFILFALIGFYFSPVPITSAQKMLSYLLIFFAVPQFLTTAFKARGPEMIKDFLFFGVLLILLGFVLRYTDPAVAISHGGRFRAIFGNPNGLGIFSIVMLILIILCREYFSDTLSKNELRWLIIPVFLAIILSGSRTSILASVLFLVFIRFYRFSPFIGFIFFVGVAVGVEVISSNMVEIVRSLGLSTLFRVETLEQGSGRYIAWNFAWDQIQHNFWFGRGFAYDEYLMDENQDFLNDLGHQGGVHNTYLIIWLNTGLVGLIVFLRAIFLMFLKGARNTVVAFPALWLVLFSIFLEPWLAASLNPFTILLVIAVTIMTDEVFQPYIRGEKSNVEASEEIPVLV